MSDNVPEDPKMAIKSTHQSFHISEIDSAIHIETKEEHLLKQILANQKLLLTTFIKFFDQKNDDWTEKERNKMTKLYRKAIEATTELLED